jgi:hypothetical protein
MQQEGKQSRRIYRGIKTGSCGKKYFFANRKQDAMRASHYKSELSRSSKQHWATSCSSTIINHHHQSSSSSIINIYIRTPPPCIDITKNKEY